MTHTTSCDVPSCGQWTINPQGDKWWRLTGPDDRALDICSVHIRPVLEQLGFPPPRL